MIRSFEVYIEKFKRGSGISYLKEDNDTYKELKLNPLALDNADSIFESMLEKSIEPF